MEYNILMSYHYQFKTILLGDSNACKSKIISHLIPMNRDRSSLEFCEKNLEVRNREIQLHIWDTVGQELFRNITRHYYYRTAIAILLVYDLNDPKGLSKIKELVDEVLENANKGTEIVLVACHDAGSGSAKDVQEGIKYARKKQLKFFELDPRNQQEVESLFENISSSVIAKI